MVRVISVHHFSSQHIHVCDDPVVVTSASRDRLLVALSSHVVQVRDLANGGQVAFTFPVVDQVQQIVYCATGNYVATLENKVGRQGKTSVYSRIYVNWDAPSSNRENAIVRARVAGRVTPSSQQCSQDVLEMIELPLKRTPTIIACCQYNGSILLACNKSLTLYHYRVRTHDISRHKFVDFEESGLGLELSFAPTHVEICEDVIACMSSLSVQVLRVGWENTITRSGSSCTPTKPKENARPEVPRSVSKDYIDWDAILSSSPEALSKLDPDYLPVMVDLPSISSEQLSEAASHLHQSSFLSAAADMTVNVKCGSPSTLWTEGVRITNLLQLKMNPMVEPGSASKQVLDEFRCLVLKPFYVRQSPDQLNNVSVDAIVMNPLQSSQYSSLSSLICVIATQQEGYCYHFPMAACNKGVPSFTHYDLKQQQNACVTVYPFTAPVSALVLEHSLLHALTETGLETYTTRSGHYLIQNLEEIDNSSFACPMSSDPVCLVGLRPFLGVEHLVLSDSYLVLLATSEGSSISSQDSQGTSWTLYSLCLPTTVVLYTDILGVATTHRWSSPSTYCHLLAEAHMIVRTHKCLVQNDEAQQKKMEELYCESCALLGDFYISGEREESWLMAGPYYKMSGLTPFNVIDRLNLMKDQFVDLADGQSLTYTPGLMYYLKTCLLQMSKASDELLFTPAVPTFINLMLDLFEANDPKQLSGLVINSKVLREYATDRVLTVMKSQLHAAPSPEPCDALALALLCIQKGFPNQAVAVLNTLPSDTLTLNLTAHHHLILEQTEDRRRNQQCLALTELATILLESKPMVLGHVLFNLVTEKADTFGLHDILQVFVELLPRLGQGGSAANPVLQRFLELYLAWYYRNNGGTDYDPTTVEALKILVRSYLSDLQRSHYPSTTSSPQSVPVAISPVTKEHIAEAMSRVLFHDCRPDFLGKMDPTAVYVVPPPFPSSSQENKNPEEHTHTATSLFKLQALLSSQKLPAECVAEAHQFVKAHSRTHGYLTLVVLCLPPKPAAGIILNFCPEAILPFCREKFESDEEWHWIISKLQQKIKSMEEDNFRKDHCIQILTDVLTYLSQTLPLESLIPMLPPGEKCVQSYIRTCQEMSHASHISALLVATGHQLLNTLNL